MESDPDLAKMRGDQWSILQQLPKVYVDEEVEVVIAPDDNNLEWLVLNIVRDRGSVTFKELKALFSGISSEDKIKRVVSRLAAKNKIYVDYENRTIYPAEL